MAQFALPRLVDGGPLTIAGLMRRYTMQTAPRIPAQWADLRGVESQIVGRVGGDVYGVWYDVLKGGAEFTLATGVSVGEFAPIPPALSRVFIPAQQYAVFQHTGPAQDMRPLMNAIIKDWLPQSGYRVAHLTDAAPDYFERYSDEYSRTGSGPIEIWLPITK